MLEEIRSKANMNYYGNEHGAQTDITALLSLIDSSTIIIGELAYTVLNDSLHMSEEHVEETVRELVVKAETLLGVSIPSKRTIEDK